MNLPEALVYNRVSTAGQEDGTSLDTQSDAGLELAQSLGFSVPDENILRDRGSGADPERPGMTALKNLVSRGTIKCVIAYSPDRIARDPVQLLLFRDYLDSLGVSLRFVHGPTGDTPEARLIEIMLSYVGQRERLEISERTNRGKRRVARDGRLPNGTGPGLYGYDYDRDLKVRRLNDAEAAVVLKIFRECVAGKTCYRIASELNDAGIKTKGGYKWRSETVRRILTNRSYLGETHYGKFRHQSLKGGRRKTTPVPESEWIAIAGFTPRIVSDGLYGQAQGQLAMPRSPRPRSKFWAYLLTQYISCERCGRAVVGVGGAQSGRYRYYRCCGANGEHKTCDARSIPADAIETLVWDNVEALISDPTLIAQNLAEYREADEGELNREADRLRRKIARAKEKESRLVGLYSDDLSDREIIDDQIRPLRLAREQLDSELVALERQRADRLDIETMEQQVADHCRRLREGLSSDTFDGKREAFGAMGVKVVASKDTVILNVTIDPEFVTTAHTWA